MRYLLIHWVVTAVSLLVVTKVIPGIEVDSFGAALIAALVVGLISATIGVMLKIALLPFIILTLGVVYFLINGLMLKLAAGIVSGFRVNGCLPAVLGSLVLTLVDSLISHFIGLS